MSFEIRDVQLNTVQRKFLERYIPTDHQLSAVVSFSGSRIYSRPANLLDGVVAITGPALNYHLFRNIGLTRKYMGSVQATETGLRYREDLSAYLKTLHVTIQTDIIDMIASLHDAVTKQQRGVTAT